MNAVVLGEEQLEALKAAMEFAHAHPLNRAQLKVISRKTGTHLHPKECYVSIPVGIEVGVTYEYQGEQGETPMWHLSFSVGERGVIHPAAAMEILTCMHFGLGDPVTSGWYGQILNLWLLERKCRVCGCTAFAACADGCSWVEGDLCSACLGVTQLPTLSETDEEAARAHPPTNSDRPVGGGGPSG